MRRQSDNWVNATHILKAAGFDKPARTRILERDVQKGNHEKVQGGYGKFQGMISLTTTTLFKVSTTSTLQQIIDCGFLNSRNLSSFE